jgi:cation diffusion facilitator CzcD-associated flavoprotein CzcO
MPADYPLFPSRDQMRDYILGFAAHDGLGAHIRFNTEVTSVRPLDANGSAGWEVSTSDGERQTYDGVIVAKATCGTRSCPAIRGTSRVACCTPGATAAAATWRASGCSS